MVPTESTPLPKSLSQALPALDPSLTLSGRLRLLHARMQAVVPAVERVAFAVHHPRNDLLSTYVSHSARGESPHFHDQPLAGIPSLRILAERHCCRVIDDMQAELPPLSEHSRWLLDQGWRSSFTAPLFWGDALLGFLFLNAAAVATFTPPVLERLQPHVELLAALLTNELGQLSNLRLAVQLALELTHLRDPETGAHLERVSSYSRLIARIVGPEQGLASDFAEDLYLFASLHDVGKVAIPEAILRKPGPLDSQERQTMDTHVSRGLDVVDQMVRGLHLAASPKLEMLRHVVAGHHELLDGSGYPLGLKAEQISLEARIVAVADIYDALTQNRVYKAAMTPEAAEGILLRMAEAGQLDPRCVQALLQAREPRLAIAAAYRDP
jgi:HD-GYP domain-containing protein (c-di-GMP phosphodiesterase class II)